ncbi:MAG: hypothetical protein KDD82_08985 [Planctomycetes bacterium]|nr:hypothetical protein [Planctomycetota bacterium]
MNEPAPPPAARASNSCLRCGLLLGLVTGVCLGSALFLRARSEDPGYVRGVLTELLDAEVPAGYKPGRAFPLPLRNQQFVTLVREGIDTREAGPGDLGFVINVNAIPQGLTPEAFMEKLEGWLAADTARKLKITTRQPIRFAVRGAEVEGVELSGVLETTNAPLRMVWVPLLQHPADPEAGWVLVSCMGTPERFDEVAMRSFLASVK